jgi:hypothetical protein
MPIFHSPGSLRGVVARRHDDGATRRSAAGEQAAWPPRAGRRETALRSARRPRAGLVTPHPGGPGQAVRRHYDRLPSMAARGGNEGRRKPPGSGAHKGPVAARKHGARDKKSPQWSAEWRGAPRKGRAPPQGGIGSAARRSIPSHFAGGRLPRTPWLQRGKGKAEYGQTRRPAKNTGGAALTARPAAPKRQRTRAV